MLKIMPLVEIEKQRVAFHESAHAAVGYALGRSPISVALIMEVSEAKEGAPSYYTLTGSTGTPLADGKSETLSSIEDYATIAVAGPIAESRRWFVGASATIFDGDFSNIARAAAWAWVDPKLFLRDAQGRARAALRRAEIWSGVGALARALKWPDASLKVVPGIHTKRMPSDEIEAILRRAGVQPGMLQAKSPPFGALPRKVG